MILDPRLTLDKAVAARLQQLNDTGAYCSRWTGLNGIDRAVLILVAQGIKAPYGKKSIEQIGSITGQPVSHSQVQASLKRLSKKDIVAKDMDNHWTITEQAFRTWINSQEKNNPG